MNKRRSTGNSRASLLKRVTRLINGQRNSVSSIIVPTRTSIQPSNTNEGMKSLVSLPPRVFLQSDPEMLNYRVQEALNEAQSHILLQRRNVAQEKALRMEAEKEVSRLQAQLKALNSQITAQATSISAAMEELVEVQDRTRLQLETATELRLAVAISKQLVDETSRRISVVLETIRPAVDEAKRAEQQKRNEKQFRSFDELLAEQRSSSLSFFRDENGQETAEADNGRADIRHTRAMPAPEFLLYGDGEIPEEKADLSTDASDENVHNTGPLDDSDDIANGHEQENCTEDSLDELLAPLENDMSEIFHRDAQAVKEKFSRRQKEIAMRNGSIPKQEIERKSITSDLGAGGELAWIQAMEKAKLES
mmetsp:Transcript_10317/g.31553  ORF Transcript_10317/g.31553 Transcript_10317/m.31553 type:complete len:365 (-) Transcript_10317:239-1333(-)